MKHVAFALEVKLREIEPVIWRQLEVPGAASLEDVHFALQLAMGWQNSHLHEFEIRGARYGMVDVDDAPPELVDERRVRLQDVVAAGDTFAYEYDFGDGWEHDVTVTKVTPVAKAAKFRLVAGARACPPEDCGGSHGYERLLEALANPRHPEHAEMKRWAGGFTPERFTVPKGGRDLGRGIEELRVLAADDGLLEVDDLDLDGTAAGAAFPDLPATLVRSALALAPMQRASLVALLAGSLAIDLLDAQRTAQDITSLITRGGASARGHRPPRAPRTPARKRR